jgi:hypothetical protein
VVVDAVLPNRSPVRFSLSAGKNAGKIRKSGIELLNGGHRTSRKPFPLTMLRSALCAASHWVAKPGLAWSGPVYERFGNEMLSLSVIAGRVASMFWSSPVREAKSGGSLPYRISRQGMAPDLPIVPRSGRRCPVICWIGRFTEDDGDLRR